MGLARQVWFRRNEFIHEGSFFHLDVLVWKARSELAEFEEAFSSVKEPIPTGSMENVIWQAPSNGLHKANWDAAVISQSDHMGIGIVIRDQDGRVKVAQCSFCMSTFDPTMVEAMAAVRALSYYNEVALDKICLECDAKNVVDTLNSMEDNCSKIGHIVSNAKVLPQKFTHWKVKFVRRDANGAAHSLVKLAAQVGLERKWLRGILDCISEIIPVEQIAISF